MKPIQQPLTATQLEILKSFAYKLTDKELIEFKEHIASYFAKKAIMAANEIWEENKWTQEDVEKMLTTKMRKSKS